MSENPISLQIFVSQHCVDACVCICMLADIYVRMVNSGS